MSENIEARWYVVNRGNGTAIVCSSREKAEEDAEWANENLDDGVFRAVQLVDASEVERLRASLTEARADAASALALLARMREACGDNGTRMQDELEQYLRELRRYAERYRWLRIKCGLVPSAFGTGQVAMTLAGSTEEADALRLDAHIDAAMNGANAEVTGPQQREKKHDD